MSIIIDFSIKSSQFPYWVICCVVRHCNAKTKSLPTAFHVLFCTAFLRFFYVFQYVLAFTVVPQSWNLTRHPFFPKNNSHELLYWMFLFELSWLLLHFNLWIRNPGFIFGNNVINNSSPYFINAAQTHVLHQDISGCVHRSRSSAPSWHTILYSSIFTDYKTSAMVS